MNILIFSSFLIILILLVQYFKPSRTEKGMKLLTFFGIIIGTLAIGLNYISNSCFGASTPIDIKTENKTEQNLKIYAITFWENNWNGNGNYVNYDTELKPNENSEFCIDNDSRKFWLVAKNKINEIIYLKEITEIDSKFNFRITSDSEIEMEKEQIAKELTFKTDKSVEFEKYLIWTNIILTGLLIFGMTKNKNSW